LLVSEQLYRFVL